MSGNLLQLNAPIQHHPLLQVQDLHDLPQVVSHQYSTFPLNLQDIPIAPVIPVAPLPALVEVGGQKLHAT